MISTSVIDIAILLGLKLAVSTPQSASALVPPFERNRTKNPTAPAPLHHRAPNGDRRDFAKSMAAAAALPFAAPANGITPERASESYDAYAGAYDGLDGGAAASSLGIDAARAALAGAARGRVLEVGVGTGLNLGSYDPAAVTSLVAVDVSEGMLSRARERAGRLWGGEGGIPVEFVRADATSELVSLFGEDGFDTVVDTFGLCVMGNDGARRCLEEMTGVVRRTGKILLIENTRASNPVLGYYQDVTASAAAEVGGKGCLYNQNVGEMIRQTRGLQLQEEVAFAAGLFRSFTCRKG